jgi:hypothetical protein
MNYKDKKDDAATDAWLKQNGILNVFHQTLQMSVSVLQARMIATTLLKQHGRLLQHNQVMVLNDFLQASDSKKSCEKITNKTCLKIMNIGTDINRKIFKAHKRLGRK